MDLFFLAESMGSWDILFLFAHRVGFENAGLEEANNPASESPPPDSDSFLIRGVLQKLHESV